MTNLQNSFLYSRSIANASRVLASTLLGAVFLSTSVAYAETTIEHVAKPQCASVRVVHRYGPPSKDLYHVETVMKCDGVEFSAFERGQPGEVACVPSQVFRRYGPPGNGGGAFVRETQCAANK